MVGLGQTRPIAIATGSSTGAREAPLVNLELPQGGRGFFEGPPSGAIDQPPTVVRRPNKKSRRRLRIELSDLLENVMGTTSSCRAICGDGYSGSVARNRFLKLR